MQAEFEILGPSCDREGQEALHLREGEREMTLYCSLAFSKIEFFYHHIKDWNRPHDQDPVTEEDRARLAKRITEHYEIKGWDVIIDRRRFCPYCHEILPRSPYDNWNGGRCNFCERKIDRCGNLVAKPPSPRKGIFRKLKDRYV